jgi:hypothetical protein
MRIVKSTVCAVALAAALAIPAAAQQPQANEAPSAGPSAPDMSPQGRDWRRDPRYSDEGRRWRQDGSRQDDWRRYGDDEDGPRGRRYGDPRERMMPPGMMPGMGPRMMGRGAMMGPLGACGPDGARIGEAMMERIERATRPTSEQRPAFDRLKEASAKAGEQLRAGCPTDRPVTPTGRLAAAEKRLAAMLDAVRTLRPAMDAYYGLLTDEQKARLTLSQGHMGRGPMGWRERRGEPGHGPRGYDRTQGETPDGGAPSLRL